MKLLKTLLLTEIKLSLRAMDSVFFAIVLGAIFGDKLAYDGASYTWLQQSFAAVGVVGICATGLMGLPLTVSDYRCKSGVSNKNICSKGYVLVLFGYWNLKNYLISSN